MYLHQNLSITIVACMIQILKMYIVLVLFWQHKATQNTASQKKSTKQDWKGVPWFRKWQYVCVKYCFIQSLCTQSDFLCNLDRFECRGVCYRRGSAYVFQALSAHNGKRTKKTQSLWHFYNISPLDNSAEPGINQIDDLQLPTKLTVVL